MSAGETDSDMALLDVEKQLAELVHAFPIQTEEIQSHDAYSTQEEGPGFGSGLAMSNDGGYIVVDKESHSVKVFGKNGAFKQEFGENKLVAPWDIFLTNSGNIVISDPPSGDVKVFSHKGKFLKSPEFGFHLQSPYGIAYQKQTKELAVCDQGSSCVYVHDPQGVVNDMITINSKSPYPQMLMPAYITYDKQGNLYVSDTGAHAIFVFKPNGDLKFCYGKEGQNDGELTQPAGVCLDTAGNILLADSGNCRVVLLDRKGEFVDYVLTWEDGLAEPQAIMVDDEDNLVVTEGSTGLVKVYKYKQPSGE